MDPAAVTPQPIMQALTGFWVSSALKAGIDLDLFSQIAAGHRALPALAKAIGAPERSTRMLAA